jgi:hypothetical protein
VREHNQLCAFGPDFLDPVYRLTAPKGILAGEGII